MKTLTPGNNSLSFLTVIHGSFTTYSDERVFHFISSSVRFSFIDISFYR